MRRMIIFQNSSHDYLENKVNEFLSRTDIDVVSINSTHITNEYNNEIMTIYIYYTDKKPKADPLELKTITRGVDDLTQHQIVTTIDVLYRRLEPSKLKTYLDGWFTVSDKPKYTTKQVEKILLHGIGDNLPTITVGTTSKASLLAKVKEWFNRNYPE